MLKWNIDISKLIDAINLGIKFAWPIIYDLRNVHFVHYPYRGTILNDQESSGKHITVRFADRHLYLRWLAP